MSYMKQQWCQEMERQFGDVLPSQEALCTYCGLPYGEHFGMECPKDYNPKSSPYALPSDAYDRYFTPPNKELK